MSSKEILIRLLDHYNVDNIKDAKKIRIKLEEYYTKFKKINMNDIEIFETLIDILDKKPKKVLSVLPDKYKNKYKENFYRNKKTKKLYKKNETINILKKAEKIYPYAKDLISFVSDKYIINTYIVTFIKYKVKYPVQRLKRLLKYNSPKYRQKPCFYVLKYGKEIGLKKYNEYIKFQRNKNFNKSKKYNQSRSVTLENMIKTYGEEYGTKFFKNYCKIQKYVGKDLNYFIEKYGINGKKYYLELNKRKAITLENLISKYGLEEGTKRYEKYINRFYNYYSKISIKCFKELIDKFKIKKYYYGENEIRIYSKEHKKVFFYDFYIPDKKLIIEFNGDFWHANPKIYNKNFINPLNNKYFNEIRNFDIEKINFSLSKGYNIIVIWENYYNKYGIKDISLDHKGFIEYNI